MANDTEFHPLSRKVLPYYVFFLAAFGLYASSFYSYLLFHSLIEVICVVILLTVFVLAWNTRKLLDSHYILFLGISFLSSAAFELVHLFAYKGFGIFPGVDANLPTQLWIAFRYVFSCSFLIAPAYITRRLNPAAALIFFGIITTLLFVAIFFGVFPDCYIEGKGLTPFKIYSEYIIILLLFAALGLLFRKRTLFDPRVLRMLIFSIASAIAADAAFTRYLSVYGAANLVGHLFLFLSAFLVYRAIVVTGIEEPMAIIFRNLEKSERQFRLIAETSVDLIFQLDLSGKVVFCSPAIIGYGYSVADVNGKGFGDYIAHDDLESAASAFRRAIGGERINALALRLKSADNTLLHLEINLAPLTTNGSIIGLQGIARDVTHRKHNEETLRESEARLLRFYQSNLLGVFYWNMNGKVTDANNKFLDIVGYTREELASGQINLITMTPPEYRYLDEVSVIELKATGVNKQPFEKVFIHKNGTHIPVILAGATLDEARTHGVAFVLDNTERKRAEEQVKSSLSEKEVMLREIHHRVKNNLQIISSLVSLQADNLVDERMREELKDVRDRVRSMALVHEKLYQTSDLAQLNFGDYATNLLHSLWRSHGALADKVRLHLAVAPVALPIEAAVPCGLLLNELAGNALKHAFPGNSGGEVTVTLEHDAATGSVSLQVRDNGVGLPVGVDWRQSRSLGLRLVQILTNQLRGTLETGSGPGTTFQVNFFLKGVQV